MTSFFSSIQNWFSGDLYGRHLGLILQEIGNRHPKAIATFVSDACHMPMAKFSDLRFQAEYSFQGTRSRRRADLAIFRDDEVEPFILIEIKYNDKLLPETDLKAGQLTDYQAWRNKDKKNRGVLILSRDLYQVSDVALRRWTVLARHLRHYAKKSDLIDMLVKYLEEEGNVMQNIDGTALTKYIKRYLCNGAQGANNFSGPVEFSNLLKNVRLMSENFHGHFKKAWKDAGLKVEGETYDRRSKIASVDFFVWNKLKDLREGQSVVNEYGDLQSNLKDGGNIEVFARHSLGHSKNWLRVVYGVGFAVSKNSNAKNLPETYLFARLFGATIAQDKKDISCDRNISFKLVTSEAEDKSEKVESHLKNLILDVIAQSMEEKVTLLAQQKKAFKLLEKSLKSGAHPLLEVA